MTKKTEKIRRYQSARVRLPSITLTTADRANLDVCIMRHGTTAEAVRRAIRVLDYKIYFGDDNPEMVAPSDFTGEQLQSIFVTGDIADMYARCVNHCGSGRAALRQALHEYATHITKSLK